MNSKATSFFSRARNYLFVLVILAIGSQLSWLSNCVHGLGTNKLFKGVESERETSPRAALLPAEDKTVNLFKKASPGVVHVTAISLVRRGYRVRAVAEGAGTGFVWNKDGHIVTNFHVIAPSLRGRHRDLPVAQVTLSDYSKWDAKLVGYSRFKDLAVLKIDAPSDKLVPIPLGDSKDLQVGQSVYAIGNPFGLDQTLTTGIISAIGREIESIARTKITDAIQTDAAINPGNSGGPLIDSAGRVVGVNTAIYSPSGASAGIGFAIPSGTVMNIVPDLIRYGEVRSPGLGFTAARGQLYRNHRGVYVLELLSGGSAEKAGLKAATSKSYGDVIISIADRATPSLDDLQSVLEDFEVGDEVEVKVIRHNEGEQTLKVKLQALPH